MSKTDNYSNSAESKLISTGFPSSTSAVNVDVRSSEYFCGISQTNFASAMLASVSSLMLFGAGALLGRFVISSDFYYISVGNLPSV